jgi:hypothetical protein
MEIGNYYRKLLFSNDGPTAAKKTEEKAINFLSQYRPYFLVGTIYNHRKNWLVISAINQPAIHFHGNVSL